MTVRPGSLFSLLIFVAAIGSYSSSAGVVDWTLTEPSCLGGDSTVQVDCGSRGIYYFEDVTVPSGCEVEASGSEDPPSYPRPRNVQQLPYPPTLVNGYTVARAQTGGTTAGAGSTTRRLRDWMALVDFGDEHGASTTYLADYLSGGRVDTLLSELDSPDLAGLGSSINDLHVLAATCRVVARGEASDTKQPLALNMSFGRALEPGEESLDADCQDGSIACEIAQVIALLRDRGTTVTAAAGNYGELLFPATIAEVMPVGLGDANALLASGTMTPAWEAPNDSVGIAPGGSLCLEGLPLPSGSSYSSALLAGWFARLQRSIDFRPHTSPSWFPEWNAELACHTLRSPTLKLSRCNGAFESLVDGLRGENVNSCWNAASEPVARISGPGTVTTQPSAESFDSWSQATHPTPEGDPCVPCVGFVAPLPQSPLTIDFSQSLPLDPNVRIEEVYLRQGSNFTALKLHATQIAMIEEGTLAQLELSGWTWPMPAYEQPSLYFLMKPDPWADCEQPGECYFTSTAVLMKSVGF